MELYFTLGITVVLYLTGMIFYVNKVSSKGKK
jgi:hypothetical protein